MKQQTDLQRLYEKPVEIKEFMAYELSVVPV